MVELIALAVLAAALLSIWMIGALSPVYAIAKGTPSWFIALRRRGDAPPTLGPRVEVRFASRADFTLIGEDESSYWTDFIIASGGAADQSPLPADAAVEDAYVARVRLIRPPRFVLGVVRLLVLFGVWSKPKGEISAATLMGNASDAPLRPDLLPNAGSIAKLLGQPVDHAPAMINFLAYKPQAEYPVPTEPIDGASAYTKRYGPVAFRTVYRTGGRLLFSGRIEDVLREATAGPRSGRWDSVAAMQYSSPPAILSMEQVLAYRAALAHRNAALERTVVVASTVTSA